ncbi:MAG: restriction endonuclease subunit S [Acinetobacter amyesii]|uniref:restriction endonuclease subunit S n=1 Tax=Acinetobacter amyesii TaxID=2942470 RepID=UPI003D019B72
MKSSLSLPLGWKSQLFGDVITGFTTGMTPSRRYDEYFKGDIPWITSGELNYNLIIDTFEKITPEAVSNTNLKIIPKGTFLIAITGLEASGTRGSCGITGIRATTNQSCMALYPKQEQLSTEYLFHYYVAYGNQLALEYAQGTKQQSYNAKLVKLLPILVPPLAEQQKIAQALTDADNYISALEKLIEKKKMMKEGLMVNLLTGKQRLKEFAFNEDGTAKGYKDSELGKIPEDWEIFNLGELLSITTGDKNTQDKVSDGAYPFFVRSQIIETSNTYSFDGEGVLTAGDGVGTGKIFHYINGKCDIHQRVYLMSNFNKKLHGYFFYLYFSRNFYNRIMSMTAKSSVDSVRKEMIADMKIYLPILEEQIEISKLIQNSTAELNNLEQKLSKFKKIKQGMMQKLLTGEIRLA